MKIRTIICLVITAIPVLLGFASTATQRWHYLFDDAFILYRYSQNLALGYGITWNPGLAPTEGYTSFLLVVFLAPFIMFDFDPLLVTRVLSYLSALAMAAILFTVTKRRYGGSTPTAIMIGSLILLAPHTQLLCLVGLETVIFALFLLITFHISVGFLLSRLVSTSVLLSVLTILTMLLRPEAVFLYIVMALVYYFSLHAKPSSGLKPLILSVVVAFALGATYLVWKAIHFGYLLPNPFYIKAAGSSLFSEAGVRSVLSFVHNYALLLSALCGSVLYCFSGEAQERRPGRLSVLLGLGLIFAYAAFFSRTDTLMDVHGGRFMYPLLPVLIYSTIPILVAALTALETWTAKRITLFPVVVIGFLLAFGPANLSDFYEDAKRLYANQKPEIGNSLMERELRLAQSLSRFPDIESVRIACGDAGVMSYFTRSLWLDVVGLNDNVIARTRDKTKLVDYFFSFQSDLVIHPGQKDFSWIRWGHGPLGDIASWARDPRWDDYVYVGTCKTSRRYYDLQLFVRKSSVFHQTLTKFLQEEVVDGWYTPFPYYIGTSTPTEEIRPTWIPRAERQAETSPTESGYVALSLAYYRQGEWRKCIEASEKALVINPSSAHAYNNICTSHNELKEWDKAITACEKALSLAPEFQLARNNLKIAQDALNESAKK